MSTVPADNWHPRQQERLDAYQARRCVDIHCHCLPRLDDGPKTDDDALLLCQALASDGITTVIATPHQLGRYDRLNSADRIRAGVAALSAELVDRGIPLEVLPGGDVRIDERLLQLLDDDDVLTAADAHTHLLLELPHELFVDPLPVINILRQRGIQAVMTHPERHRYLQGSLDRPRDWVAAGAVLQITAGSLVGDFGPHAYDHAWRLLQAGLVGLVATDAHDAVNRPPRMSAALKLLTHRAGNDVARALVIDNPLKVLEGKLIEHSEAA